MDNESYKEKCSYIDTLGVSALKYYLKHLEQSSNDPFPDDDLAGDIALTLLENRARIRLKRLEQGNENAKSYNS